MHSAPPPVEMPPDAHIQNNHCCNGSHHVLPALSHITLFVIIQWIKYKDTENGVLKNRNIVM
jgi:hypothetical protein